MIDIDAVRRETSACNEVIHLHNSGAALMPDAVAEAVCAHIDLERRIGGYEAEEQAAQAIAGFYNGAAAMFGCADDEIAFMENATAAWNAVFYGIAQNLKPGQRILTGQAEYASNYIAYLQVAKQTGCSIEVIPNDASGQLDVDALEASMDGSVALISITHVPTSGGLVNPAAEVGKVARSHDVPYLLDACQSAGQMPLDVDEIGCDALSCTGRKFLRGPRGTGILYVRRSSLERLPPATLDLRGATWTSRQEYQMAPGARRFENWENNVAGQIGLGVAIDYANRLGLDAIYARIQSLAEGLRQQLTQLEGVRVLDLGTEKCGIVSFVKAGHEPAAVVAALREKGIHIGASNQSSTLLDFEARQLTELNRAGVHYYNSLDELDRFCAELDRL